MKVLGTFKQELIKEVSDGLTEDHRITISLPITTKTPGNYLPTWNFSVREVSKCDRA